MNIRALVGGPKPTRFLPFCRYQNELSETQLLKSEESRADTAQPSATCRHAITRDLFCLHSGNGVSLYSAKAWIANPG